MSDKPLFIVNDTMLARGAAVVKSFFPDATDEECKIVALGAFASILSEYERGNVRFATSEDEPSYSFGCSEDRKMH